METKVKTWAGKVPATDDFGHSITTTFIDGKTKLGPWAIMSPKSHDKYGVGLGTGKGQRYVQRTSGAWEKDAG